METKIDISPAQLAEITDLFQQHLPGNEVWAYGSRIKGNSCPASDLDLVVFVTPEQSAALFELKEAFEESYLPFRIDLFVWDELPEQFKNNIRRQHAVLIAAEKNRAAENS